MTNTPASTTISDLNRVMSYQHLLGQLCEIDPSAEPIELETLEYIFKDVAKVCQQATFTIQSLLNTDISVPNISTQADDSILQKQLMSEVYGGKIIESFTIPTEKIRTYLPRIVTSMKATQAGIAKLFGVTLPSHYDDLSYPDFHIVNLDDENYVLAKKEEQKIQESYEDFVRRVGLKVPTPFPKY